MDEFYHGDETEKRLVAVGFRAADSILRSLKYLLPDLGQEILSLFTVDSLWGLCLLAAGWFLATVVSGPIGLAINLALLGYGVYSSWETMEQTYGQLKDWFWGFYQARTEDDLETAGKHFAAGVAKGGVFVAQLVVTHKALKFASAKLVSRFPPPEKLKTRFSEEQQRVAERRSGVKAESETERSGAPKESEGKQRAALRRVQELGRTMEGTGAFQLGRDVSGQISDASTVGGVVLLGLLGIATVGVVVAVVSEEEDKRRKR